MKNPEKETLGELFSPSDPVISENKSVSSNVGIPKSKMEAVRKSVRVIGKGNYSISVTEDKPKVPSFIPDRPLTEAERYGIAEKLKEDAWKKRQERNEMIKEANRQRLKAYHKKKTELKHQEELDDPESEKERKRKNKEDLAVLKLKMRQGLISRSGLPAIRPLSWLKDFRTEYEVSSDDLRRLCMAFIFGHSIDELKIMTSNEHSHNVPVIVYYFAKCFIRDTENGVSDAMEKLLDRIFGKMVQKEVVINANLDLNHRNDITAEGRQAELARLEGELSNLMRGADSAINANAVD